MAEAAGFGEGTPDRVALAVDEAATNVIEHAYHGAAGPQLEVRFEDRGAEFQVEVVDTGAWWTRARCRRVDLDRYVNERRTGGLGVHLMEKIMDSVTFQRSARRNVCRLVKRKDGQRAGAPSDGSEAMARRPASQPARPSSPVPEGPRRLPRREGADATPSSSGCRS